MKKLSLTEIANYEATDKGTQGPTPEWPCHNYTDIYEAYFYPYRQKEITVLEVGLGVRGPNWNAQIAQGRNSEGGASMKMWYRYLENARIFGIDVNPATFLENDRIRTAVVDQGDPDQLEAFVCQSGVTKFDFIIDDGCHWPRHQQVSLGVLFPHLAEGGLYIIEDLLENGKDDVAAASGTSVLNTRKVLRLFQQNGEFPKPNALPGTSYLRDHIDSLAFHCPKLSIWKASISAKINRAFQKALGRPVKPKTIETYLAGTESLCVIRKK